MPILPSLRPTLFATALAVALPFITTPTLAHTDEYLDTLETANGGQLRMAGPYHFELVLERDSNSADKSDANVSDTKKSGAREKPVLVYVTDHGDTPIPTAGATGTVTLLSGKDRDTVTLKPDGENRLRGVGRYAVRADLKAIVSVTRPGEPAEQARFTPFAPKNAVPAADAHRGHAH